MTRLPPTVRALGVVSLLTDASSEMIYPLLPSFLTRTLGAGPVFVGLIEGLAESTASLLKLLSGWVSDRLPRKKPLVVGGYALSSLARPLVAVATAPWHVLAIRVTDRIGKGVRGAPRDALIAEVTRPGDLGRAYGFHRAMDHAGAMIGPLLATLVLLVHPDLRTVFALAAVPALASVVVLVFAVREDPVALTPAPAQDEAPSSLRGSRLVPFLLVLALFTIGNSSDAFLLLRAQQAGVTLTVIPLLWAAHHLVKALASTHGGALSDRVGRREAIAAGWTLFAIAYAVLAVADRAWQAWAGFLLYGLFHALTEGAERALVADLAPREARGRAFGLYHATGGALLLPASLLAGILWQRASPRVALLTGSALALAAAMALFASVPAKSRAGAER